MEIYRDIIDKLKEWKDSPKRKPILLKGARQIGKTWVMETFGKECFDYCVHFDFDRQSELHSVFKLTKEPARLVKELAMYTPYPIIAGRTLLIFDEIQECEEALNSLKYFCEDAPQYHIIAAGSLLGVVVKRHHMTVPVGKVKVMRMYPISFKEFLRAADESIYNYIEELSAVEHLPEIILHKLQLEYRRYLISGGMPEAVTAMLENKGMEAVDDALQDIIELYELDFAKYADPLQIARIHAVWRSLPAQLSKENRKFVYNVIRSGARSKDYEDAIMWLEDAGIIHRVHSISKPALPLTAYLENASFKVYASDCGVLRRLAKLTSDVILKPASNYVEFKGALAENVVLQSLLPIYDIQTIGYWTSAGKAEVEFVVQHNSEIIPIEVKAEGNISGNSLSVYAKKYEPSCRVRLSMLNLQWNGGLLSAPAPLAPWLPRLLEIIG